MPHLQVMGGNNSHASSSPYIFRYNSLRFIYNAEHIMQKALLGEEEADDDDAGASSRALSRRRGE